MTRVALLSCSGYVKERIDRELSRLPVLSDFPDMRDKTVLLKPNLLSATAPERAATTHPAFLRGVIDLVKSQNPARIWVGDSPGIGPAKGAARAAGLLHVCEETGVEWINFSSTSPFEASGRGVVHRQFYLAREASEAEVIISLPKLKTHGLMYFTGAMKNLFGLLPGLDKAGFHMRYPDPLDFARMIVDLNRAVKADYAIMDGILAMEGRGPGNGDPRELNIILASSDLLALDITAADIIGYDGPSLPIHSLALNSPLGVNSPGEIEITGEPKENHLCRDFKRIKVPKNHTGLVHEKWQPFLKSLLVPRPVFNRRTCITCGKCLAICPPQALEFTGKGKGKRVTVNYDLCIRCYCCDEICPVGAVSLRRRF